MASQEYNQVAVSISTILNIFFMIIIIVSNAVVLFVLGHSAQLRTPVRLLMVSLTVTDFLIGVVILPYVVNRTLQAHTDTANRWDLANSGIFCQVIGIIRVICLSASSFTLVALTYERYVAIAYPLKHTHMFTVTTAVRHIICVWAFAVVVGVTPLLGISGYAYSDRQFVCWPNDRRFSIAFVICVFCGTFLTMISMYLCIFRAVKKHRSVIHALVLRIAEGFTGQKVERFRAITTISIVLGVYSLTWAPFCLAQIIPLLPNYHPSTDTFRIITTCFLYANSACNPWIYCGLNATFRETFKRKLRFILRRIRNVFGEQRLANTAATRQPVRHMPVPIRVFVINPTVTSEFQN